MGRWISVKDSLPHSFADVLVATEHGDIGIGYFNQKWGLACGVFEPEDIVYWMPLPEPPKEETK